MQEGSWNNSAISKNYLNLLFSYTIRVYEIKLWVKFIKTLSCVIEKYLLYMQYFPCIKLIPVPAQH